MKKAGLICVGVLSGLALCAYLGWRQVMFPIAAKPQKGKKIVACIGDSITFGAGVRNRRRNSYPACLQKDLGSAVQVINYGMNGRTLLSTGDKPYIREKNYQRSFTDSPSLYLCLLGTNDAKPYNWDAAAYERELAAFLGKYIAAAEAEHVFVMKPPKVFPIDSSVKFEISGENLETELDIIDRVSAKVGVRCIDLYAFTEHHPEYFTDGVHPNAKGNRQIATYIAGQLRTYLGDEENYEHNRH